MDSQTFDLLQTLTNGRFTAQDWTGSDELELMAATSVIQSQRLDMLKIVKEQMGLPAPRLGQVVTAVRPIPRTRQMRSRNPVIDAALHPRLVARIRKSEQALRRESATLEAESTRCS